LKLSCRTQHPTGNEIAQAFYKEPQRYAYTFQNYVFLTRMMQVVRGSRPAWGVADRVFVAPQRQGAGLGGGGPLWPAASAGGCWGDPTGGIVDVVDLGGLA
jgi:hypothetical protein